MKYHDPIRFYSGSRGRGYFFWDETWAGLYGPARTLKKCRDWLAEYAKLLDNPAEPALTSASDSAKEDPKEDNFSVSPF